MLEALFSMCPQAPRICPGVLLPLVLLCKKIVAELSTFEVSLSGHIDPVTCARVELPFLVFINEPKGFQRGTERNAVDYLIIESERTHVVACSSGENL